MANRFWDAIKPYKTSVFIPTCIASLLANWLLLINGYGCPDNLCEGAMLYHGGDWALSLGRWVIRYINAATLNIVLPEVNVAASIFCCCIVTILLGKLFAFSYKPFLALTSIFLATGEAVTCQYLYIYMDLAFTWALLLSALSAYFVLTGTGRKSILFAALALAFALGGYQAYVGFTCCYYRNYAYFAPIARRIGARLPKSGRTCAVNGRSGLSFISVLYEWYASALPYTYGRL